MTPGTGTVPPPAGVGIAIAGLGIGLSWLGVIAAFPCVAVAGRALGRMATRAPENAP